MEEKDLVHKETISSSELCLRIPMSDASLRKYLLDPKFPRYMVHGNSRFKIEEVLDFLKYKPEEEKVSATANENGG